MEVRKKQTTTGLDGWVPICEKNLPYELTASFLLLASKPGVPMPIKLQEQHRALFPLDKPITEESGERLAAWALGKLGHKMSASSGAPAGTSDASGHITPDQAADLEVKCTENGINPSSLKAAIAKNRGYTVERFAQIKAEDLKAAKDWISTAIERRKQAEQTS